MSVIKKAWKSSTERALWQMEQIMVGFVHLRAENDSWRHKRGEFKPAERGIRKQAITPNSGGLEQSEEAGNKTRTTTVEVGNESKERAKETA